MSDHPRWWTSVEGLQAWQHAWRQARPSHDFGKEWLALTFDEIIEVARQPLIQSRVERVTGGRRKIRRRHPHFRLPLADAFSHGHV